MPEFRTTEKAMAAICIPARMTDDQAYAMANYYLLFKEFLDAGTAYVIRTLAPPRSTTWTLRTRLRGALSCRDWTPRLQPWVNAQMSGVRQADHGRPITVGYSNIVLAKLPSNKALDYQSVHRFTAHGYSGLNATFLVLHNLQRTFAGQPVLLEEFGYPGQVPSGGGVQGFDPRTTANLEAAVWTYLYSGGFAGGAKWNAQ